MIYLANYSYFSHLVASGIFIGTLNWQNNLVLAQITPDSTLGQEQSQLNSISQQEKKIDGGAIRGKNLFHSFSEFNVRKSETVNFANPEGIANIFSRVTGNNISQILGDLGVSGNANLFLMNPNGIIFGEKASLNVNGSFLATTANSIKFADGNQFIANSTNEQPLLTVNVPIGLQFADRPGKIINQAQSYEEAYPNSRLNPDRINSLGNPVGLQVKSDRTLALIGGEIILEGGNLTTTGGNIKLGSVDANSLIGLDLKKTGIAFDYSAVENFLDITATNRETSFRLNINNNTVQNFSSTIPSILDATSNETSSSIDLQGRNINITNGSQLLTPSLGDARGGNLTINAAEQVNISGSNRFFGRAIPSSVLSFIAGKGNAGNIKINTRQLTIQDSARIESRDFPLTPSQYQLPIQVKGEEETPVVGEFPREFFKLGKTGNILIDAKSLNLNNGKILANTGLNKGGSINLQIDDNLELRNQSKISTSVSGNKDGGNINIAAEFIITSPQDNSDITANADSGRGGNIAIKTSGIFGIQKQKKITRFSDITVSSNSGIDGILRLLNYEIQINTTETESSLEVAEVTSNFTPYSCYADTQSQYIKTGRGGIPLDATNSSIAEHTWEDWRILETENSQKVAAENLSQIKSISNPINPIQGWMINQKGEVMLTANPITVTPHPPEAIYSNCN